jgi:hypothetical protein
MFNQQNLNKWRALSWKKHICKYMFIRIFWFIFNLRRSKLFWRYFQNILYMIMLNMWTAHYLACIGNGCPGYKNQLAARKKLLWKQTAIKFYLTFCMEVFLSNKASDRWDFLDKHSVMWSEIQLASTVMPPGWGRTTDNNACDGWENYEDG